MTQDALSATTLDAVRPGTSVRVLRLSARPDVCLRLREMGVRENAVIHCVQARPACICHVHHSRVGLSSQLARHIVVERV